MSDLKILSSETQRAEKDKVPNEDRKKVILYSMLGISVVVSLILSYKWYIYESTHIGTENALIESDIVPVNSRMMGFVNSVLVKEHQKVKAGDVLMTFDDTDINVEYGFKKARHEKASADFRRAEKLVRSSAISASDFEFAKANLTASESDLQGTELKLKYTKIIAPTSGIISKKSTQVGQFVQPGQGLFLIVSDSASWVRANFKETQIHKIYVGMPAEIRVDAFPDLRLKGHVKSISPTSGAKLSMIPSENATGNYTKIVQKVPVLIQIDTALDIPLPAGLSAHPTLIYSPHAERRHVSSEE